MSSRTITARVAVAAALLPLVAGCSDDEPATAAKETTSSPTVADVVLPDGVRALPEGVESGPLAAGRYRIPLDESLAFDVDLLEGSDVHSSGLYISFEEVVIKVEVADERYGVPEDSCHGEALTPTGPAVDDLVAAIRAQPGLEVSAPEPVTLEGASGQRLRVRIDPAFDTSTCRDQQVNLPGIPGTANNVTPAYRGEWWIVATDDDRRVVLQGFCDPCEAGAADRIQRTVGTIAFTATP